jgi:UPF0716 family protein affecting phage T7 exclusion
MHPVKAIAIGLLAWPAAEIVVFFCVAAAVGFFNAIILIVLMSMAGAAVLRHFGSGRQRIDTAGGFIAASAWRGGMAPGLGGVFLLIPGFLTSVLGIAILFPLSRRWLLAGFQRLFATRPQPAAAPGVVDLAPDEWRPLPADKLPPSGRPTEK